jgi:hypothetical protein
VAGLVYIENAPDDDSTQMPGIAEDRVASTMSLNQDSGRMMKVLLAALFVLINATVSGGTELRDDTRQAWNAYVRGVKLVTPCPGIYDVASIPRLYSRAWSVDAPVIDIPNSTIP